MFCLLRLVWTVVSLVCILVSLVEIPVKECPTLWARLVRSLLRLRLIRVRTVPMTIVTNRPSIVKAEIRTQMRKKVYVYGILVTIACVILG